MQIKFTEQTLSTLSVPEGMRDHQWFDAALPGFGFRKFASGQAAYFVKYRVGQKQRKVTLGKYTPGLLAQMRRSAGEILAEARLGTDPRSTSVECEPDISLAEAVRRYLPTREPELAPNWFPEVKRYLEQHWERFHSRPLKSLDRGELVRELDDMAQARGKTTADHARKALSALFNWAIDRGYLTANPLYHVKRKTKGNGRERVLSVRELVAVWQASLDEDEFGRIIRLMILTLQRKSEIGDLQTHEIDADREQQINLPEDRTKNRRSHIIPLSSPALAIITSHPQRARRVFLFGDGQRGFQGWSKAKGRLDLAVRRMLNPALMVEIEGAAGDLADRSTRKQADKAAVKLGYKSADDLLYSIMPRWTLHDLRRTGGTLMNEFSIADPHIIEAILNHISGHSKRGVAGVYNRASYEIQKRSALKRWAEFVGDAVDRFAEAGLAGVDAFVRRAKEQLDPEITSIGASGSNQAPRLRRNAQPMKSDAEYREEA